MSLQLPLLIPTFRNGFDYSPGRTGLQTTWMTLVVVLDVVVLGWWFSQRSPSAVRSLLPGVIPLVLMLPLVFIALVLRVIARIVLSIS